ncbi:hypothetical protein [Streptomyces paromomycinus]|uniref:Cell surface antigen I/II n=1 Tax=Streptomyces paromomycinus TaxID=92743 RepID=A0A401VUQ6_STREY|nr:hypothetical protein [Streptomyces paromomycinus]GCD40803.1 cell surface antigen I/II [Streptomyces paromomycinus]
MGGWLTDLILQSLTTVLERFFRAVVDQALNPLLDLLGSTLLATPTLGSIPRITGLWTTSWTLALACYTVLVTVAGLVVMAHESLQTRTRLKEILPRLAAGVLASASSLFLADKAIALANALSQALLGPGLDADSAGQALARMIQGVNKGFFVLFVGVFVIGMLVILLVSYAVRISLTLILVAGAPLALMCHALPQTEGIARWWWRVFAGLLGVQLAQSLALITALRLFLAPDGYALFGPTPTGLAHVLVALALLYILIKLPFWILRSAVPGYRGPLAVGLVRSLLYAKTFHALHAASPSAPSARSRGRGGPSGPGPVAGRPGPRGGGPGPVPPVPRSGPGFHPQPGAPHPLFHRSTPPPLPQFRSPAPAQPVRPGQPIRRTPPGSPVFQPPIPRTAAPPPRTRPTAPAPPVFRPPVPTQPPPAPPARTTHRPPARPVFVQPAPEPPGPVRASGPAPPAVFRPPVPEEHRAPRPRREPPPPPAFTPPRRSSPPPPRGGPHRGDRR